MRWFCGVGYRPCRIYFGMHRWTHGIDRVDGNLGLLCWLRVIKSCSYIVRVENCAVMFCAFKCANFFVFPPWKGSHITGGPPVTLLDVSTGLRWRNLFHFRCWNHQVHCHFAVSSSVVLVSADQLRYRTLLVSVLRLPTCGTQSTYFYVRLRKKWW
jgi:hypothetical protein